MKIECDLMPKHMDEERKKKAKLEMLKLLSVDGRASIQDMAKKTGLPKTTAYALFLEVEKEYGLKFVPEIGINNIWKYELVRLSREGSKHEVLGKTIEKIKDIGFEEYIIFIKFESKIPTEEEIKAALGKSYIPQYAAIVHGEYNLIIYAVSRSYEDVNSFIISIAKHLSEYNFESEANKIERTFGYFPIRSELIKQFAISDNYKNILLELNKNGRVELDKIRESSSIKSLTYTFDRLKRTEILKRVTCYETTAKNVIGAIIRVRVTNYNKFLASKENWFEVMIKSGRIEHNEYLFICDISNPQGGLIFCSFENNKNAELLFAELRDELGGTKLEYIPLSKTIFGSNGIRNFDMTKTEYYKALDLLKFKNGKR